MIDARRMEVYSAIFDMQNNRIRETKAEIIDHTSFDEYKSNNKLLLFGDGSEKCTAVLSSSNHIGFVKDFHPSASDMVHLALEKYKSKQFEDTAYFEPFYLKDFVAGKPKVKGLYL